MKISKWWFHKLFCYCVLFFFFTILCSTLKSEIIFERKLILSPDVQVNLLKKRPKQSNAFFSKEDLEVFLAQDLAFNLTAGGLDDIFQLLFKFILKDPESIKILKELRTFDLNNLINIGFSKVKSRIIDLVFCDIDSFKEEESEINLQTFSTIIFSWFVEKLSLKNKLFISACNSIFGKRFLTRLWFKKPWLKEGGGFFQQIAWPKSPANNFYEKKENDILSTLTVFSRAEKLNKIINKNCQPSSSKKEVAFRTISGLYFYLLYLIKLKSSSESFVFNYVSKPLAKLIKKGTGRIEENENVW